MQLERPGTPVLETDRLILRELTPADADDLYGWFSDPEVMRWFPSTRTREEAEAWIERGLGWYERYGFGFWGAVLRETGALIGYIGLVVQEVDGDERVEIGYMLARKYWGHGFATEGAIACREYAFDTLGIDHVISIIHPQNMSSRRVAERNGMTIEKQTVKWDIDVLIYAVSREDLRGR
ncbi:MAG: GNAT family N-acetyltransferase [bacterium]|nr:GNAT family N-acetyltransferase [bacterium]